MKLKHLAALGLAVAFVTAAHAAGTLGQDAPPLKIASWIKGKPVDLAAARDKQIVVVEFWATWCGPCRTSIPHLTELQKKFKDQVVFVGVSDETAAKVKPFVEKLGEQMDYVVALDDQRKTSAGYMGAFGVNGIPHAFIVDKAGKLVWHGHPMDDMESVLSEVIAGKFNLAKAQKRDQGRQKLEEFYRLAAADKDQDRQDELAKAILAIEADAGSLNPDQKFDPAAVRKMIKFNSALQGYQIVLATNGGPERLTSLEKVLEENGPPKFDLAEFKTSAGQSKLFGDYFRAATGRGDQTKLPELASKLGEIKSQNYERSRTRHQARQGGHGCLRWQGARRA
jgi:thiol-disulfide isomerase/thioredoxin